MKESKWKIALASAVGTSHLELGTGCQDSSDFRIIESPGGEVLVAVMADGAGTGEFSRVGADLACSLFIQEIERFLEEEESFRNLDRNFGELWLDYFRQKINESAEEHEKPVREFACTFIAAIVWDDGAVFYQVGDGGIVYLPGGPSEGFCFGIIPEKKIYANATDFITDDNVKERLLYESITEPVEELIMFTDGVERVAIDLKTQLPYEPFLTPMMAPLRKTSIVDDSLNKKLENFLHSPRINEKTDDDKTLFLASRHPLSLDRDPEFADAASEDKSSIDPDSFSIEQNNEPTIKDDKFLQEEVDDHKKNLEVEETNQIFDKIKIDEIKINEDISV